MTTHDSTTQWIQDRLDLIASGQDRTYIRDELLQRASRRIHHLVNAAMRGAPELDRWEEDVDLLQVVLMRLDRAVSDAKPQNPGQFFIIAAQHVRWATIDMLRHHFGPKGHAAHHQTRALNGLSDSDEQPNQLFREFDLVELHEAVDRLPPDERDVWHLCVYLDMTQALAAETLGVSSKTVQRRLRSAKVRLASALDHPGPGSS